MKKIVINVLVILGIVLLFFSVRTYAAETVTVTIIQAPVQIGNISVYSPQAEYPVIFYKDICYIPMTYNLCENMDLAVGFDAKKGLFITKHITSYKENKLPFGRINYKNDTTVKHTAYIPEYPIYLNGSLIDNQDEQYPILNFRDITYFPLTYRFATEEFDIQIMQSEQYFLIASPGVRVFQGGGMGVPSIHYFSESDDESIDINVQNYAYTTYVDETDGFTKDYAYNWWDIYKLYPNGDGDILQKTSTYTDYLELPGYPFDGDKPYSDKVTVTDNNHILYDCTELANYEYHDKFRGAHGREYVFGNITFIGLSVAFGENIPILRYPELQSFIWVMDSAGIRPLYLWDTRNILSDIIPDGCGGYYITSDFCYPLSNSRTVREVGSVYHYTASGDFNEVKVPDTNSVEALGVHGKKLYVRAVYHENDKTQWQVGGISAVNSGYYEIDTKSGSITKICPYFPGKTLLTSNGNLYAIKEFGFVPKIMNIRTGQELAIK